MVLTVIRKARATTFHLSELLSRYCTVILHALDDWGVRGEEAPPSCVQTCALVPTLVVVGGELQS
jgi:hypothetical protein